MHSTRSYLPRSYRSYQTLLPSLIRRRVESPKTIDGLAAGLVGGLVGTWAMTQFQNLWTKASEKLQCEQEQQKSEAEDEPSTAKLAAAVSTHVLHHAPTKKQKTLAGEVIHYSYGTAMGGAYGAVAEYWPAATSGLGVPFGAALWAFGDEAMVPAMRLARPPWKTPVSTHVYALVSHFVYGITTELTRRAVRKALRRLT